MLCHMRVWYMAEYQCEQCDIAYALYFLVTKMIKTKSIFVKAIMKECVCVQGGRSEHCDAILIECISHNMICLKFR